MALETNGTWIAQEQHKNNEQQLYVSETVSSRAAPKVSTKQHSQTERFTQTEYRGNCVEVVGAVSHKDSVMFEQAIQHHQPVQMYSTIEKKDIAPDKGNSVTEFPFCYNVNMLQKVQQTQAGSPTATAVASIATDDKTCYRLDVAQPFGYNYALVNQMSLAAAASTASFKCDTCGLVFAHLSLLNHHKRIHNSDNLSPERTFSNEQSSEIKVQPKTATKSRNCNRCGGEVGCDHSNTKKKVSKFVKCENCQSPPTSTTITTANGSFPPSPPDPNESLPEVINIPNKGLHLVKRHNGVATVTKCHKCNGSGIIFVGSPRPPASDKPFRCNVCDGSFSRYSSLWSHKRLHTGDKPFKCEMCGLTFARAAYLKNHLRVHSGEKPYKCNVCGMQFSQSPHLKNHERIHSGERPYQCEVCEKTFARHSTLWNHRRIHTGEKPYRCSVCGSAFNQATHLKNHAKVHTGEKPHRCDICEVGFSDRFALKRHRLIHEKYCRTASSNSQTQTQLPQSSSSSQNQQSVSQVSPEMFKCEVAFPGQQPSVTTNPQPESEQIELYKCDVATTVAFPGSQQSHQPNSTRPSQQQNDIYKCDVGTSVSFPVQQQQTQATADNTTPTSQNPADAYKVTVSNNNPLPYQNQAQQQTNEMSAYKYDVSASVSYPNSGQNSQQSTSQQTSSSAQSQQISQFDVGSSTVAFPEQNHQTQQTPQPSSISSPPEQLKLVKIGGSSFSEVHDGNAILGP